MIMIIVGDIITMLISPLYLSLIRASLITIQLYIIIIHHHYTSSILIKIHHHYTLRTSLYRTSQVEDAWRCLHNRSSPSHQLLLPRTNYSLSIYSASHLMEISSPNDSYWCLQPSITLYWMVRRRYLTYDTCLMTFVEIKGWNSDWIEWVWDRRWDTNRPRWMQRPRLGSREGGWDHSHSNHRKWSPSHSLDLLYLMMVMMIMMMWWWWWWYWWWWY